MTRLIPIILFWLLWSGSEAWALCQAQATAPALAENTTMAANSCDLAGNQRTTLGTLISGEDTTNGVMKVETQFTPSAVVVADTQVKASAGFLHCINVSQADAAPTAGDIKIFNNTAESGTLIWHWNLTTAVFVPFQICPDVVMSTGIYIGFTSTNDVNVSVSYR